MPSSLLQHCAAASLALLATTAIPAQAAPYMIIGLDEKPGTDAQGKSVVNPTGKDAVLIVDTDNLAVGNSRQELYVGMSRARALLGLLLHQSTRPTYDELVRDFARRLRP